MTARCLAAGFVFLCCFVATSGALAVGTVPDGADSKTENERESLSEQVDGTDQIVIEIALQSDGSAKWRQEHRIRLDDEAATEGFERTRDRIEADPEGYRADVGIDPRRAATAAEQDTGRVMVVENISVSAEREQLTQEYGIVVFEFRWYGFAETGETLRAGDALEQFPLRDNRRTLLMSWPANTTLAEVSPEPDDRRDTAVVWNGPLEFATEEPRVVLESESLSFGPDLVWSISSNDVLLTLGGVLFVFAGLVGTGALALRRRRSADNEDEDEDDEDEDAPAETTAESGESAAGEGATESGAGGSGDSEPPEELLSNEERVLALLEEEGGRIKQQDVVQTLDWSETKTSEVVSDLRETDRVEVYRLGRNNVLALPGTGLGYESDDESGGERS